MQIFLAKNVTFIKNMSFFLHISFILRTFAAKFVKIWQQRERLSICK